MTQLRLPVWLTFGIAAALQAQSPASGDWSAYGHDAAGTRFSPLTQITPANVSTLRPAWIYRTGDRLIGRGRFEATPLMADGTLYFATPLSQVIALDPATGAVRWRFDARIDISRDYGDMATRGVAIWIDQSHPHADCARRVFLATLDARLLALDAATGHLCGGFGNHGSVDLQAGIRPAPEYPGEYEVTSPPAIAGDLVIVGSAIADNHRLDAPSGMIRAYDARTGLERWRWDPIPRGSGAPGRETWVGNGADRTGAANAWSVFSVDGAHDLVFIPVGSASPDFYGGGRRGQNHWADAVVALRASTGKFVWGFQVAHHDLWDYDVPAQPVLFTLRRGGRSIPALAQVTKIGHLFVLNRLTGESLFPVEERPVPQTDLSGEEASPTQPFPAAAFRLVPESLPPGDVFGTSPENLAACRDAVSGLRNDGVFTPPTRNGSLMYPGNLGGSTWSSAAVDESRGVLITPLNHLPFVVMEVPRDEAQAAIDAHPGWEVGRQHGTPYIMLRRPLLSPDRVPCSRPPWGVLTAVDLNGGTVKWSVPLGRIPWVSSPEAEHWGSVNLGGAVITASGLVFIAATLDHRLRAFDRESGRELWNTLLPVGGYALPMTYEVAGRQYVVISAGGHDRLDPLLGDYVIAYALPAPGAPTPDTTIRPVAGTYAGEIRSGGDRHVTTLTIRGSGDSLTGTIEFTTPTSTGTVTGRQVGDTVWLTIPFHSSENQCDGTLMARGELVNEGRLLDGGVTFSGPCSTGTPPDSGAFGLWRK